MKKVILIIIIITGLGILTFWAVNRFSSDSVKATALADNALVSSNPVKIQATGGEAEIVIGFGSGTRDTTVLIPIIVKTLPEKGIGSCNFNIKYDTNLLEAVEVIPEIKNNIANLDYSINNTEGMVSFLYTSSNNLKDSITKPGMITNVMFKIKKDAEKGVTKVTKGAIGAFGDTSLNKINAVFVDGEITIN